MDPSFPAADFAPYFREQAKEKKAEKQFPKGKSGNPTGKSKEQVNPNSDSPDRDTKTMHANSTVGLVAQKAEVSRSASSVHWHRVYTSSFRLNRQAELSVSLKDLAGEDIVDVTHKVLSDGQFFQPVGRKLGLGLGRVKTAGLTGRKLGQHFHWRLVIPVRQSEQPVVGQVGGRHVEDVGHALERFDDRRIGDLHRTRARASATSLQTTARNHSDWVIPRDRAISFIFAISSAERTGIRRLLAAGAELIFFMGAFVKLFPLLAIQKNRMLLLVVVSGC